jgi:tetratricopeptide (TPR) repeat protein
MSLYPQADPGSWQVSRRLAAGCLGAALVLLSFSLPAQSPQNPATPPGNTAQFPTRALETPRAAETKAPASIQPFILTPSISSLPDITNPPVQVPTPSGVTNDKPAAPTGSAAVLPFFAETNGLPRKAMSREELLTHLAKQFETARYLRSTRQLHDAETLLVDLMSDASPEALQQSVLLELAALAQDANELTRAQQIYAQFLSKWPNDPRTPEVLLQQGLVFRRMGLHTLAFTKFYGVMTSALVLKNDQLEYYARLVLQAQIEIAETQYELGKYADAAEFFSRLLKQNSPSLNKSQLLFKLTRCHAASCQYNEVVSEAQDFLAHYQGAPEQAEVRFHLALALKELGRNNESLQQVLYLLQEQRASTRDHPEIWTYWQQRTGNLIANQLYREGDYTKALNIYLNLARLDTSPQWQLPVHYQIGMTYERLWQPQKATDIYTAILAHEKELGAEAPPNLKSLFEMARWRLNFIQWQTKAESVNRQFHNPNATNTAVAASLPKAPVPIP